LQIGMLIRERFRRPALPLCLSTTGWRVRPGVLIVIRADEFLHGAKKEDLEVRAISFANRWLRAAASRSTKVREESRVGVFLGSKWKWRIVALAGLAVGCSDIFGPRLPGEAMLLDPIPPEFDGWWALAERCSGVQGDFEAVRWYIVPDATTIPGSDGAAGQYHSGKHRIVVAESSVRNGYTVRHEMLHALLRGGGHPRALFLEQCGGVVSCGGDCRAQAALHPTWDLNAQAAAPDEISLSVELLPAAVSRSEPDQCPSIVVNVQNISGTTRTIDASRGVDFGWIIDGWGGGSGGGAILEDSLVALETRPWSYVLDCPSLFRQGLPDGQHSVRGRLGSLRSSPVTFTVMP
jgi:hypothetical protein